MRAALDINMPNYASAIPTMKLVSTLCLVIPGQCWIRQQRPNVNAKGDTGPLVRRVRISRTMRLS
jgi:hypothetical protein